MTEAFTNLIGFASKRSTGDFPFCVAEPRSLRLMAGIVLFLEGYAMVEEEEEAECSIVLIFDLMLYAALTEGEADEFVEFLGNVAVDAFIERRTLLKINLPLKGGTIGIV